LEKVLNCIITKIGTAC